MIRVDKRTVYGPMAFMCYYESLDDKYELYSWLSENFGGVTPLLNYSVGGTKNDNWSVSDNFMHHDGISGGVIVRVIQDCDAVAFKLGWL